MLSRSIVAAVLKRAHGFIREHPRTRESLRIWCPRYRHNFKAACWEELARDRHAVFSAALALLDDERDPAVLARRAGIALLKPSSVQRILNQARRIVERC